MKSRVNYRQIKTLADVRAERLRIAGELDGVEERLNGRLPPDYRHVQRRLRRRKRVTTGAGKFYSAVEWAMTAYNMVRSVIGKYKEASARRKEATDDETETSG
ncbi:MAG: hypothetical protein ACLR8Y_20390 [Alistipes indistinctus]